MLDSIRILAPSSIMTWYGNRAQVSGAVMDEFAAWDKDESGAPCVTAWLGVFHVRVVGYNVDTDMFEVEAIK